MTTLLESDDELVLLTSCADTSEAALVRSLLEAHGLTVLVEGEHHRGMQGMLGELQEVRVLVKRKHLSEAQALLDASTVPDEEPDTAPAQVPTKLDAPDTGRARRRKRLAWAVLLFPLVPLLLTLATLPRELGLRPHRELYEQQVVAGDEAFEAGRFQAAESAYRQALGAAEQLPEEEGHRPDARTRLALALMEQARWRDAEPLLRAALDEHTRQFEQETHHRLVGAPAFANDHEYLGEVLRNLGQYGEAEIHLRKAIATYRQRFAASEVISASLQLSAVMMEWERPALAVSALEGALRALPVSMDESPDLYLLLETLAAVHQSEDQHEQAVKVSRRALALGERLHGELNPELLDLLDTYAGSLRALGRGEEALVLEARQQRIAAQQQATDSVP